MQLHDSMSLDGAWTVNVDHGNVGRELHWERAEQFYAWPEGEQVVTAVSVGSAPVRRRQAITFHLHRATGRGQYRGDRVRTRLDAAAVRPRPAAVRAVLQVDYRHRDAWRLRAVIPIEQAGSGPDRGTVRAIAAAM